MSDDGSEKPHSFNWGLGGEPEPEKKDEEPPALVEPPQPSAAEPPKSWDLPTQLTPETPSWELPTQINPEQPTRAAPASAPWNEPLPQPPASWQMPPVEPAVEPPVETPTGIDALFGTDQFQDYDESLVPTAPPPTRRPRERDLVSAGPRERSTGAPRALLIVAGALVGVIVLVLVFIGGTKLQLHSTPATAPTTAPATPTPTPTPTSTKTLGAGTYPWDALNGGECLTDFQSAWQQTYTVVDCGASHTAQLVVTGAFADAAYPGTTTLASRMNVLCSSLKYVNYATAGKYDDIVVAGSYPQTEEQWSSGDHRYYCFMSRSGSQPIEGNLSKRSRA